MPTLTRPSACREHNAVKRCQQTLIIIVLLGTRVFALPLFRHISKDGAYTDGLVKSGIAVQGTLRVLLTRFGAECELTTLRVVTCPYGTLARLPVVPSFRE